MKVLVAVDGSETSLRAVANLIDHASWFREPPEVHLLTVHPPIPIGLVQHHVAHELIDRHYREECEAAIAPARQRFQQAGIEIREHMVVGDPAAVIVKLARELSCDLICLGTHGRGALASAIVGSVASKVLHIADRPVLLSR